MSGSDRTQHSTQGHLQEESHASSERLAGYVPRLLELVNDLVFSVSPDARRVLYLNKSAETIYGRPLSELLQNDTLWLDSIHQDDRVVLLENLESISDSKRFELEFRIVQPDGNKRYLQGSFRSVSDDRGEQVAIGCIAKDITNRIRAEYELEESKAIYHSLVESLPINVFRKDREGRLVFLNNKCCETYGQNRDQLIGKNDHELFDKELADKYQKDDRWVLQTGLPFHDIEFHPREGDEYIYVEVLKAPVTSANGRRIGIQGMFWDVTDRKKAEIALEKARDIAEAASQAKSDFLANVSHEIRTPLNAVIGMTDLLLGSCVERSQHEYLQMIRDSGQSLLTLINDILDFSKIESGKLSIDNEWFDLRERLGDTLRSLAHRAHCKDVDLICNIDPNIPIQLLGDSRRLRQVIVNLIGNSIKFTEQGEVSLEVNLQRRDGDNVDLRIQIQDSGIGIPEEKLISIFDEFVQVDTSSTRKFGGTGLGLSIASRLVALMGGRLEVTSKVGKGSQFFFNLTFPVGSNPMPPSAPEEFREVPIVVMIANSAARESIDTILKSWRLKTFCVSSVDQAIKLVKGMSFAEQPIRIVLAESQSGQDSLQKTCDCSILSNRLSQDEEVSPPSIIAISKTSSKKTDHPSSALISQAILQPVKHSELRDAIVQCLELDVEARSTEQPLTDPSVAGSYKILLAEDNPVNQKLAVGILEKHGHCITVVDTGIKAIEAIEKDHFDVVLMDVQMPEMDGIEATKQIRNNELSGQSKLPILAMTAHAMAADRQRCLESGMDDYLSKPFKAKDLVEKISQLVVNRSSETVKTSDSGDNNHRMMVDWNQAFETVGGDRNLLRELIEVFLSERDTMVADLVKAIDRSNPTEIRRSAHSLKGALNHLGAVAVAKIAEKIEKQSDNDANQNSGICKELQNQLGQLTVELERFKNSQ